MLCWLYVLIFGAAVFERVLIAQAICKIPTTRLTGQCVPIKECAYVDLSVEIILPDKFDNIKSRTESCSQVQPNTVCCEIPNNEVTSTSVKSESRTSEIKDTTRKNYTYDPMSIKPSLQGHKNLDQFDFKSCGKTSLTRVAFGENVKLFEHPWAVRLGYARKNQRGVSFKCGGSLISDRYVLTAAHCVKVPNYTLTQVRLGELDERKDPDCDEESVCAGPVQDLSIEKTIPHSDYSFTKNAIRNDIALLRLSSPANIKQKNIKTICLPFQQETTKGPFPWIVVGWGATENSTASPILKKAILPPIKTEDCISKYAELKFAIDQSHLCAGGKELKDACRGDSGGPLISAASVNKRTVSVQFGVVSFGVSSCGVMNVPGIYENVNEHLEWILDNME